jgi:hypothetical protein
MGAAAARAFATALLDNPVILARPARVRVRVRVRV